MKKHQKVKVGLEMDGRFLEQEFTLAEFRRLGESKELWPRVFAPMLASLKFEAQEERGPVPGKGNQWPTRS